MKPLEHAGARRRASVSTSASSSFAECSSLPSNQLALARKLSSSSSSSSTASSSSASGSRVLSYFERTSPIIEECDPSELVERLKRGEGISDWQYLELVERCTLCSNNFLPKYFAAHQCNGKDTF